MKSVCDRSAWRRNRHAAITRRIGSNGGLCLCRVAQHTRPVQGDDRAGHIHPMLRPACLEDLERLAKRGGQCLQHRQSPAARTECSSLPSRSGPDYWSRSAHAGSGDVGGWCWGQRGLHHSLNPILRDGKIITFRSCVGWVE